MSIAKSYTFTNNTIADPAEVNQNFDDCVLAIKSAHHSDADGTKLLPADIASGWGLVPQNGVIMYHGTVASIPASYVFCNGSNGTPDMRSRFVVGVDSDAGTYPLDATGGEASHTLSSAEMPVHTHLQNAHNHTDAGHTHTLFADVNSASGSGNWLQIAKNTINNWNNVSDTAYASIQNTTATNQNAGSGGAHENRPPFKALVFIMKT